MRTAESTRLRDDVQGGARAGLDSAPRHGHFGSNSIDVNERGSASFFEFSRGSWWLPRHCFEQWYATYPPKSLRGWESAWGAKRR